MLSAIVGGDVNRKRARFIRMRIRKGEKGSPPQLLDLKAATPANHSFGEQEEMDDGFCLAMIASVYSMMLA